MKRRIRRGIVAAALVVAAVAALFGAAPAAQAYHGPAVNGGPIIKKAPALR
jgi:hypothetical protein